MLPGNRKHGFPREMGGLTPGSMEGVGRDDPASPHFQIPHWLEHDPSPWNLVRYLAASNGQRGFALQREPRSHLAEAKRMLDEYPPDKLARAVWQAGRVARHPFGFGFVRKQLGTK